MSDSLSKTELIQLMKTVFSQRIQDRQLAILVDVPDEKIPDQQKWRDRRIMAQEWWKILDQEKKALDLETVRLFYYPNVHSNNADLPQHCYESNLTASTLNRDALTSTSKEIDFETCLSETQLVLAPTQFSTTAPLKVLAQKYNFRAATMPGFSPAMLPALRLDWSKINQQVNQVKQLLDNARRAEIEFQVNEKEIFHLTLDLRFRNAHASGGLFPDPGAAGNLPSGESYIVPYEGERGERSLSNGILPVQFGDEIVQYRIERNVAVEIVSSGEYSTVERKKLQDEPAYGNLAELGFGVLASFGIKPIGEILLDEKLGLHIAFGRSDHFGGAVGVKDFHNPENVVHADRIYIQATQPRIHVKLVSLVDEQGEKVAIIQDNQYTIF